MRRARRDTRERILEAARALFAREGYEATTVRRIGRTLGISDAAIYYHFPSKRAIYESAVTLPGPDQQQFRGPVASVTQLADEMAAHHELWTSMPNLPSILLVGGLDGDEMTADISLQLWDNYRAEFEKALANTTVPQVEVTAEAVAFLAAGAGVNALIAFPGQEEAAERNRYFAEAVHRLLPVFVPASAFAARVVADAS